MSKEEEERLPLDPISSIADAVQKWAETLTFGTSVSERSAFRLAFALRDWESVRHWLEFNRSVGYADAFHAHVSSLQTEASAYDALLVRQPAPDEQQMDEARQTLHSRGHDLARRLRELVVMLRDYDDSWLDRQEPEPHSQPPTVMDVHAGGLAAVSRDGGPQDEVGADKSPLDRLLFTEDMPAQEYALSGSIYNLTESLWKFSKLLTQEYPTAYIHGDERSDSCEYADALHFLVREVEDVQRKIWVYPKLTPAHAESFRAKFDGVMEYAEKYHDAFDGIRKRAKQRAGELARECSAALQIDRKTLQAEIDRQEGNHPMLGVLMLHTPGHKPNPIEDFANAIRSVWYGAAHGEKHLQADFHQRVMDLIDLAIELNNMIVSPCMADSEPPLVHRAILDENERSVLAFLSTKPYQRHMYADIAASVDLSRQTVGNVIKMLQAKRLVDVPKAKNGARGRKGAVISSEGLEWMNNVKH